MLHKYSQIHHRITYKDSRNLKKCNEVLHLGQLKLLISEIFFLSKYAKNNMTVLYIGAAEGYHIFQLSKMFPNINFELWDPEPFAIKNTNHIKIHNKYFTNEDAQTYSKMGKNILFISDIRNLESSNYGSGLNEKMFDKMIQDDMIMQADWVKIIQPFAASLKFKLPYVGKTMYLNGEIYLQPFAPRSTETRLFTQNYTNLIEYDGKEIDEKLAYLNTIRCDKYDKWKKVFSTHNILNTWDTSYAFDILAYYLKKYKHGDKIYIKNVTKLFIDIITFLKNKYGNKYNVLSTDLHQ